MPTVETETGDFEKLLGFDLPKDLEKLNDLLFCVKGEAKYFDAQQLHIEIKDSNRPDLWSVEGLARALRGLLNLERGLKKYTVADVSGVEISVDARLEKIRPYIACAILKEVELDDTAIRQIMHLQDKMDQTYGRQRRRTSIGLYDFDLVAPPLRYGVSRPDETSFVPLEFDQRLTLKEILEKHPKGLEFGHIVSPYSIWPIFLDSENHVLSFPPVINSNDLGRVTNNTRNVLIEVTGTVYKTVANTLVNIALALADRKGRIYSARIHYPYGYPKEIDTPELQTEKMKMDMKYAKEVMGMNLKVSEITDLLERSRYGIIDSTESSLTVEIPCYRVDIMHPIDILEDIAISYDYNKMRPRWPQLQTVGYMLPESVFRSLVREIMIGLGFQEILSFSLTNPNALFTKMSLKPEKVVELTNPKVTSLTCVRNWLLPSLMDFLSHNTHIEYPQKIFEVGYCTVFDKKQENKTRDLETLACVTIHSSANYTQAKSALDAFLINIGTDAEIEEIEHGSFIEGRVGKIKVKNEEVGFIGEIQPQVLQNWNLENPAVAFEIRLDGLRPLIENTSNQQADISKQENFI